MPGVALLGCSLFFFEFLEVRVGAHRFERVRRVGFVLVGVLRDGVDRLGFGR